MKILFLHTNQPCYLAESLLHGLRENLAEDCVDIPRYDSVYRPLSNEIRSKTRGNGFSLYGLLHDSQKLIDKRYFWQADLEKYDYYIISNIWEQYPLVKYLFKRVNQSKIIVLDPNDRGVLYPYSFSAMKEEGLSQLIQIRKLKYFKREYMDLIECYNLNKILPLSAKKWIEKLLPEFKVLFPISFSIPEEKITKTKPTIERCQKFPQFIVDEEIKGIERDSFYSQIGSDSYLFDNEKDYYMDLQNSQFGITTKRAGWDCLRHYELAANGCIVCFKNLDLKPKNCAPHGLHSENCISYNSARDLMEKINSMSNEQIMNLQQATYTWIYDNTTKEVAKRFLNNL